MIIYALIDYNSYNELPLKYFTNKPGYNDIKRAIEHVYTYISSEAIHEATNAALGLEFNYEALHNEVFHDNFTIKKIEVIHN